MQGYYLETCPKMRYKAEFHPSELLCMRTYAWVPLCVAVPAIQEDDHCTIGQVGSWASAHMSPALLDLLYSSLYKHPARLSQQQSTVVRFAYSRAHTTTSLALVSCGWAYLLFAAIKCC